MNIFYFVSRWPRYNQTARADRILSNVESLLNIGHQVSLLSADPAPDESLQDISQMPIEVIHVNPKKIGQSLTASANKPDLFLFNSTAMEQMYSIFLYSKWNKCPRVLEIDRLIGVQKWRRNNYALESSFVHEYDCASTPSQPEELFEEEEASSIMRSDYYFCSTDFIAHYLKRNLKINNYILNSVGVPLRDFISQVKDLQFREFRHRKNFAFIGNVNSEKNVIMIELLVKQLWSLIRAQLKDVELHIYGSGYNKALQAKKKELEKTGIFLRGYLQETDELQTYRAVLYPLQHTCGGKGVLTEAWFHHTPVITTPVGAQGYFFETTQPKFSALDTGEAYPGFFKERTLTKEEQANEQKLRRYYSDNKLSQDIRGLTFGGMCDSFSCFQFAANAVKIYTKEEVWRECLLKSRKSLLKHQSEQQLQVNLSFGLSQVQLSTFEVRKKKEYKQAWNSYLKSRESNARLNEKRVK